MGAGQLSATSQGATSQEALTALSSVACFLKPSVIMETPYKLRCELRGHTEDVSPACLISNLSVNLIAGRRSIVSHQCRSDRLLWRMPALSSRGHETR